MTHPDPRHPNHARLTTRIAAAVIVCGPLATGPASAQVVYDNGGANSFDGVANDTLSVRDDTGGNPTHLDILGGAGLHGSPDSLYVEGSSSVTIYDGSFAGMVYFYNNAKAIIHGGEFDPSPAISLYDNATADFFGGSTNNFWAQDNSVLNMHGGTVKGPLGAIDHSVINVYGGTVQNQLSASGHGAVINVYGGSVDGEWIVLDGQSGPTTLNVYGGSVNSTVLAFFSSAVNLYGYGFKLNGVDVGFGVIDELDDTMTISGFLSDGTALSLPINRNGTGNADSRIELFYRPVPEPASLALLGLGGLLMLGRGRRRGGRGAGNAVAPARPIRKPRFRADVRLNQRTNTPRRRQ